MTPGSPLRRALTAYPAIDLKEGVCVRLRRGDMSTATIYADDPAAMARTWQEAGFSHLHVVDLDGAFAGRSRNQEAVEAILAATDLPVQLGGGVRDMDAVAFWLEAGVSRVILGSAAVRQPELVRAACDAFPGRIVIGIDARAGRVATEGWAVTSGLEATELARRVEQDGAAAIIFTEIEHDGMLGGLALDQTVRLAGAVRIPVIASGGVGSRDDLEALRRAALSLAQTGSGGCIEGVIIGRALYDGRISALDAIASLG